jgi:hypothetical protein
LASAVSGLVKREWEVTYWQCLELPVQHSLRFEEMSLIQALAFTRARRNLKGRTSSPHTSGSRWTWVTLTVMISPGVTAYFPLPIVVASAGNTDRIEAGGRKRRVSLKTATVYGILDRSSKETGRSPNTSSISVLNLRRTSGCFRTS